LPQKRLDYLLRYRRDFPIAVVEAKTLYAKPGDGLQQAKEYAQILGLGAFQLSLDFAQRWEHNPRRSSSPCSEVARTGTHDFKFRCRYPATFPRRSRHRGNEALRARSFVLCTRSKRRRWRFTRPWTMAACPATNLGRRITWRCSNAGWMKAWLPEIVSAGQA